MREKWQEMSWFRRGLLAILAVMVVGFGIATPVVSARKGIEYADTLLYLTEEGDTRRYTGRLDGQRAEFTVRPGGTVEYLWGEETYGPYQVVEDPSAAPRDFMTGLEIRRDGQALFRGGFSDDEWPVLYGEDGEPFEPFRMLDITYSSGGKTFDSDGRELSARDLHEPRLTTVARLVLGEPALTHRGSFGLYLLVTLLAAFNIFQICCPGLMFRWSIMWHVRDPDSAEPSDFYIVMEKIEWVVVTGLAAWCYWLSLTLIH